MDNSRDVPVVNTLDLENDGPSSSTIVENLKITYLFAALEFSNPVLNVTSDNSRSGLYSSTNKGDSLISDVATYVTSLSRVELNLDLRLLEIA